MENTLNMIQDSTVPANHGINFSVQEVVFASGPDVECISGATAFDAETCEKDLLGIILNLTEVSQRVLLTHSLSWSHFLVWGFLGGWWWD